MTDLMLATAPAGVLLEDRGRTATVDALGMPYRALNEVLYDLAERGVEHIHLRGVTGQRYIGTNLRHALRLTIEGVPGQDLGAFMDGPYIELTGDAQDGCGNTMNSGTIVINGSAGDILGHSMRGGEIFVRHNVGYRVGIHMKEYGDGPWGGTGKPVIVIGGTAQHFLGEYMAGGVLILLGAQLAQGIRHPSHQVGTGMHGGAIYVRGAVREEFLGREVGLAPLKPEDEALVARYVARYAEVFAVDAQSLLDRPFIKLAPLTKRPYGRLYAY